MTDLYNSIDLLIDIGNTNIKVVLLPSSANWVDITKYPIHTYGCYSNNHIDLNTYMHSIYLKIIQLVKVNHYTCNIQNICISCVNSIQYMQTFLSFFKNVANIIYCKTESNTEDGLINMYDNPYQLGIDRWLALLAAHHLYPSSYEQATIVISCGTATTIDFMFNKQFVGGYIIPGFLTMHEALYKNTANIKNQPILNLSTSTMQDSNPQLNTANCIYSGILTAHIGFLKQNIEAFLKNKNIVKYKCLLHGGCAYRLQPFLTFKYNIYQHIIMLGMAKFLKNQGLSQC